MTLPDAAGAKPPADSPSGFSREQALALLAGAERLYTAGQLDEAVDRMAREICADLGGRFPLVLSVMGGAVVFTGHLLPRLDFPLDFDILKVSRYGLNTGGGDITWSLKPRTAVRDRVVLVLDDILDIGDTMLAIRERVLRLGARAFYSAVLTDKKKTAAKPIRADFVGLSVPDRFVFGCGMDAHGVWRNLPAIYALRQDYEG